MSILDLWVSGERDVFGHRFRDAWYVRGWENGSVPEGYVCWLEQKAPPAVVPTTLQLDLFAETT